MEGVRRRPVERLRPAPAHVRRAVALTTRELVLLAGGVAGATAAWTVLFAWVC